MNNVDMERNSAGSWIPNAAIVEIDVDNVRVRVRCPYAAEGTRGHSHWVNLGGYGLAEEYRIPACVRGQYYRVSVKGVDNA